MHTVDSACSLGFTLHVTAQACAPYSIDPLNTTGNWRTLRTDFSAGNVLKGQPLTPICTPYFSWSPRESRHGSKRLGAGTFASSGTQVLM